MGFYSLKPQENQPGVEQDRVGQQEGRGGGGEVKLGSIPGNVNVRDTVRSV